MPPYTPDWPALAKFVVERTFQVRPGERVVYLADPLRLPEFFDEMRAAMLRAGAIEQATVLSWTPRLSGHRQPSGAALTDAAVHRERVAHLDLLNTADIFIWMPTDFTRRNAITNWESEWMLARWRGRGLHIHWFPDPAQPPGHPIHDELSRIYEKAILELDHEAQSALQDRVIAAIRGRTLRVTTTQGTELTFRCAADGWYGKMDGLSPRSEMDLARCTRDREEELPAAGIRTVPVADSVEGLMSLRGRPYWNGFGLDFTKFGPDLDLVFRGGRIVELRSKTMQAELDEARARLTGDWDRLGEIVIGTNHLLTTPAGAAMPTHWGHCAGGFRFHLGMNWESGGTFVSNLWVNLLVMDTTVEADGHTIIENGKLLVD
jgi:leucyl aminopeptidase (aminopeptidase T)